MSARRAKALIKTRVSPSSHDISSRRLHRGKSDQMARDIVGCDFCAAEESLPEAWVRV